MAKRLAISFFIVLGVAILLVSGFMLVLFLAPGFSAFGIKYIAKDTHSTIVNDTRIVDIDNVGLGINGSIKIESYEIPIEICFAETGDTENQIRLYYYDNFNGITNSDIQDPYIEVIKEAGGNIVIKTNEFHKFIYEASTSDRLLKIYLPMAYVIKARTNLVINSSYSNVTFTTEMKNDDRVPNFNNLTVNTSGQISINNKINATTFTQTSDGTINVGADENKFINATNYILSSGRGKINIGREISGDLEAKTNNGDIRFISCKNLVISTNGGKVLGMTEADPTVNGIVKIESKSGSVKLGKILGSGTNSITTNSGNVEIEKFNDAVIKTTRGSVSVKSVGSANITTNVGKVTVEEALNSINVTTTRGNIYLGGEGITLNNPTVFSRLGKVFIYSASGKADVQTISSNISFNSTNCTETVINCGGKLTATNLIGKVTIDSNKNIDISFNNINDNVTITLADTVTFAKITATNNNALNTRFILTGKNVTRYERSANGTFSKAGAGTDLSSDITASGPLLKVTGKNAEIEVYFNSI